MLEALLQFCGEFLLSIVLEGLAELGLHSLAAPFSRKPQPVLAGVGWLMFGALAGGLSLLVAPHNLLHGAWRVANLVCTPVAVAVVVHVVHRLRQPKGLVVRRGAPVYAAPSGNPLRKPVYAFVFALAVAVVRFCIPA